MKISHFLNIKTEEWDVKMFMFSYRNDLVLGSVETFLMYTCLSNELPQLSEMVVFAEFE